MDSMITPQLNGFLTFGVGVSVSFVYLPIARVPAIEETLYMTTQTQSIIGVKNA